MELKQVPVTLRQARALIRRVPWGKPPTRGIFAVAVSAGLCVVGVAIGFRPTVRSVPRGEERKRTAEIVMFTDDIPGAAVFLMERAQKAAQALGYKPFFPGSVEVEKQSLCE